jgi:hypothetical protein
MGARWYNPQTGRWISADTIVPDFANPQSLNRYAYVYNNPLRYTDPTGHYVAEFTGDYYFWPPVTPDGRVVRPLLPQTTNQIIDDWGPFSRPRIDDEALRAPEPTSSDMTDWLIDQMKTNAQAPVTQKIRKYWKSWDPRHKAGAYQAWVALVRGGAIWDFKDDIPKEIKGSGVVLGEFRMDFDAVANIHFGYVGRAAGFGGEFLKLGAGIAHWREWKGKEPSNIGPWYTYFDDPFDHWCIDFGIALYDLQQAGGFDELTPAILNQALWDYLAMYGPPSRGIHH